jgi:hypothetical protein
MDRDLSGSRAILIGNSIYSDPRIPGIPGAALGVKAMSDLLTGKLCEWPADRIQELVDVASPSELARRILAAIKDVDSVGILLVYYVGHGQRTTDGQLALTVGDTDLDPRALPHTAILYDAIAKILRGCQAATKLVILDCCHAELGAKANYQFLSSGLAEAYPVDGLYFIGASRIHQKAKASISPGLTYFTRAFIDVVRTGIPEKPPVLRLDQIFVELRSRMLRAGLPEPVESGIRGAHQLPFARNAAPPRTHVDLEAEVRRLQERLAALEHARGMSASSVDNPTAADNSHGIFLNEASVLSGTPPTVKPLRTPPNIRPVHGGPPSGRGSPKGVAGRVSIANRPDSLEESRGKERDDKYTAAPGGKDAGSDPIGGRSTPARRPIGRRRGRSKDHRLWLGLGGVIVVAVGAIIGIIKFEFPSYGGPAHTMITPARIGSYARTVDLERQTDVAQLRSEVIKTSSGQASEVVSAVYKSGNSAAGNTEQILMFIGGHLANADPTASITSFTQKFPGAHVVRAGSLGGKAACVPQGTASNAVAVCAWFDNDSFGEIVSPTMNATALARTMLTVRPSVELLSKT